MTETNSFNFHTDAGHGWLAVKRQLLEELGCLNKITAYSYVRGGTLYLEEDLDAGTFIAAYEAKYGRKPDVRELEQCDPSPIRSYKNWDVRGGA